MKKLLFFFFMVIVALFLFSACSDEEIIPEEESGTEKVTQDTLPPDNDPVIGTIDGEIAEFEYLEQNSTSTVALNRIPHTLEKFLELREQIANTPQGAAAMMIVAMRIYQHYPEEGMKCLTANSTSPLIGQGVGPETYNGMKMLNTSELKRKLKDYSYLPMVYFKGASPSNGYSPEGPPYVVELIVNQYSYVSAADGSMRIKLYISTLGADSARPVTVRKVDQQYLVTEYSSLYLAPKNLSN